MSKLGIVDSNQKIVSSGLLLHFDASQLRSYPGSGTTWTDLSGNGNNGDLRDGSSFVTTFGGGIIFDGNNDDVNISSSVSINSISTQITVSAFMIAPNATGTIGSIIFRTTSNNWDDGFGLYFNNNSVRFWVNNYLNDAIRFGPGGPSGDGINNITTPTMFTGTYSNANGTRLYRNDESPNTRATSGMINNPSSIPVRMGESSAGGWNLAQTIYLAMIYNRELSASEILQNYNALKSRFGL